MSHKIENCDKTEFDYGKNMLMRLFNFGIQFSIF